MEFNLKERKVLRKVRKVYICIFIEIDIEIDIDIEIEIAIAIDFAFETHHFLPILEIETALSFL
jgi:hypothetical protein